MDVFILTLHLSGPAKTGLISLDLFQVAPLASNFLLCNTELEQEWRRKRRKDFVLILFEHNREG